MGGKYGDTILNLTQGAFFVADKEKANVVRGRLNHEVHEGHEEGRRRKGVVYYPQISQICADKSIKHL